MTISWWRWLVDTPAPQAPILVQLLPPTVAALALLVGWRTAVWVARQRATIDLIEKRESTDFYRANSRRFSELRRAAGFAHLNDPVTSDDQAGRRRVVERLNHYELVARGIRPGVLSGGFSKRWMGGPFVRDWNAALDRIEGERWKHDPRTGGHRYDPKTYQHFERVARRWSPRDARRPAGPAKPSPRTDGPGAEPLPELEGVPPTAPASPS